MGGSSGQAASSGGRLEAAASSDGRVVGSCASKRQQQVVLAEQWALKVDELKRKKYFAHARSDGISNLNFQLNVAKIWSLAELPNGQSNTSIEHYKLALQG